MSLENTSEATRDRLSRTAALLNLITLIRDEVGDPSAAYQIEDRLIRREYEDLGLSEGSQPLKAC